MKKICFIFVILIFVQIMSVNSEHSENKEDISIKIYYIDHSMLRLIPIEYEIGNVTKKEAVNIVSKKIVNGLDSNKKIMRIIPKDNKGIKVKVENNTAYVDLRDSVIKEITKNKTHNILAIYQIVNSLTSIDGIDNVKFTFDGKVTKGNIPRIDMREAIFPDYYI